MTTLDVDRLRRETLGTTRVNHLNNAGAGLMPDPVYRTIVEHLELESQIGGYEAADKRRDEIAAVYRSVGRLIGADARNIAVTENATASFIQALSAIVFKPGDVILTTQNDYASNQIMYLSLASRFGIELVRAPDHPSGGVDVSAVEALVHRRRPKLVAVTHIPTSSGLVQSVADIGAICRQQDTLYLVDACQSVGQMPLDVEHIGCDFLSATARKFLRGPRGLGFLYISDRALDAGLEPLFPDLHGADWIEADVFQPLPDARRFENWEFPFALLLGLGRAADYALDLGLEPIRHRAWTLAASARDGLAEIDGVRVLDRGSEPCAIVTIATEGHDAASLVHSLRAQGINTSHSMRDYAILDFDDQGVEGAVRISPHYYNTEEEIEAVVAGVAELT
jgi:selenocysteine lyase/cysteine desulfurase